MIIADLDHLEVVNETVNITGRLAVAQAASRTLASGNKFTDILSFTIAEAVVTRIVNSQPNLPLSITSRYTAKSQSYTEVFTS